MTRREVVEQLQVIEARYPVAQWQVAGVSIWPLVKILVFFSWFRSTNGKQHPISVEKKARAGSLRVYVNSLWQWLRFLITPLTPARYVFSGAPSHRVIHQGQEFNRYFEPMMDYLETRQQRSVSIEQSLVNPDKIYYRKDRILDINSLFAIANLFIRVTYKKKISMELTAIKALGTCINEIETTIPGISASQLLQSVDKQLLRILAWAAVFDRVFARLKPTYAFGLCYYSAMMFGMNLSAFRRGIISVDMQHGTQGPLHVAYNNFSKVPEGGFNVVPKVFWCWNESSVLQFKKWIPNQNFHKQVLGGSPWLEVVTDNYQQLTPAKKIVLYTLQPIEPLIEEYMLKAMELSKDSYTWRLRLHPRQLHDKDYLMKILEKFNLIDAVQIDDPLTVSLPLTLKQSAVHISRFSGSVIEAGMMGIPNIIIDPIGLSSFENEVASGEVIPFLEKDPIGLVRLIDSLVSQEKEMKGAGIKMFEEVLSNDFL